ncbi:hypothetical protein L2E82_06514 [Cichorium intybus]|uniref:Uncharacterized protein n=1 Tax=Cichorium intybus TaxID=13427 RepID=A0ACB9HB07_CICIN|nr:hypothetical protein L2E82_06514 [Cichorium intybus]
MFYEKSTFEVRRNSGDVPAGSRGAVGGGGPVVGARPWIREAIRCGASGMAIMLYCKKASLVYSSVYSSSPTLDEFQFRPAAPQFPSYWFG